MSGREVDCKADVTLISEALTPDTIASGDIRLGATDCFYVRPVGKYLSFSLV